MTEIPSDTLLDILHRLDGIYGPTRGEHFARVAVTIFLAASTILVIVIAFVLSPFPPTTLQELFLLVLAPMGIWGVYMMIKGLSVYAEFRDGKILIHGRTGDTVQSIHLSMATDASIVRDRHGYFFIRVKAQHHTLEYPLDKRLRDTIMQFAGEQKDGI